MTTSPDDIKTLTFRCPAELDGLLPPPIPAAAGLPEWFKAMPSQAFNSVNAVVGDTVKRCPPFIDGMTTGFLLGLICDVIVENGEFRWDNELPPGGSVNFARSPIGFHDASQVSGTPLFDADRFMIKFHNLWTIEAPKGYALYFTHPANRFDLPFTTLSGLVDCDRYVDNWIHFPAHWHDKNFVRRTSRLWRSASSGRCARMAWTAASRRSASAGQFGLRHGASIIPGAASKRALCGDASVQPPDATQRCDQVFGTRRRLSDCNLHSRLGDLDDQIFDVRPRRDRLDRYE